MKLSADVRRRGRGTSKQGAGDEQFTIGILCQKVMTLHLHASGVRCSRCKLCWIADQGG